MCRSSAAYHIFERPKANQNQLTLSQTTSFRLFQMRLQTTISKLMKMAESTLKKVENTVGKGEIARYKQFLFFPQCFQKTCNADT